MSEAGDQVLRAQITMLTVAIEALVRSLEANGTLMPGQYAASLSVDLENPDLHLAPMARELLAAFRQQMM
jgi:hypothetical protein